MRIYAGGIPFSASAGDLRALFDTVGTMSAANTVARPSQVIGFIEMPNESDERSAIAKLNGHQKAIHAFRQVLVQHFTLSADRR